MHVDRLDELLIARRCLRTAQGHEESDRVEARAYRLVQTEEAPQVDVPSALRPVEMSTSVRPTKVAMASNDAAALLSSAVIASASPSSTRVWIRSGVR